MDETENPAIGIIVLAAGASSRMNQPKQLLKFQNKTLLRRAAETAVNSNCEPKIVVLGANFERLKKEVEDLPVNVCYNENFAEGLSSSIKKGLQNALQINPKIAALMIILADQPFVDSQSIELLTAKFTETKQLVVAADYGEKTGVPAIFDQKLFFELVRLKGDRGAQSIFEKFSNSLERLRLPNSLFDIDTPEDFARLSNLEN